MDKKNHFLFTVFLHFATLVLFPKHQPLETTRHKLTRDQLNPKRIMSSRRIYRILLRQKRLFTRKIKLRCVLKIPNSGYFIVLDWVVNLMVNNQIF